VPDAISGDDLGLTTTYPQCFLGSVDRIQLCLIMETPQTPRFTVPEHSPANAEFTTRKRTRFFTLYDYRSPKETVEHVCRKVDFHLPPRTAESWLKQHWSDGYEAFKRPGKQREGPDFAISNGQFDTLLSPTHNLVCRQDLRRR
jgi:hypothetical protein